MRGGAITELVHGRGFATGLTYGGIAAFIAMTVALFARRGRDLAGLAFAPAVWLAVRSVWGSDAAPFDVLAGVGLLAAGGYFAHAFSRRRGRALPYWATTAIAIAPGAYVLAHAAPGVGSDGARDVMAIAIVAITIGVRDFDRTQGRSGAQWLLFAITAFGVYVGVPDTELPRIALAVAIPFVLLSLPGPVARLGPAGSAALVGVFAWTVFVGGRARPGSIVGGLATIGLLVADPIGRRVVNAVRHRPLRPLARVRWKVSDYVIATAVIAAVHAAFVAYASRVVAGEPNVARACIVLLPVAVLLVFAAPFVWRDPAAARRAARRHGSSQSGRRGHHRIRSSNERARHHRRRESGAR